MTGVEWERGGWGSSSFPLLFYTSAWATLEFEGIPFTVGFGRSKRKLTWVLTMISEHPRQSKGPWDNYCWPLGARTIFRFVTRVERDKGAHLLRSLPEISQSWLFTRGPCVKSPCEAIYPINLYSIGISSMATLSTPEPGRQLYLPLFVKALINSLRAMAFSHTLSIPKFPLESSGYMISCK